MSGTGLPSNLEGSAARRPGAGAWPSLGLYYECGEQESRIIGPAPNLAVLHAFIDALDQSALLAQNASLPSHASAASAEPLAPASRDAPPPYFRLPKIIRWGKLTIRPYRNKRQIEYLGHQFSTKFKTGLLVFAYLVWQRAGGQNHVPTEQVWKAVWVHHLGKGRRPNDIPQLVRSNFGKLKTQTEIQKHQRLIDIIDSVHIYEDDTDDASGGSWIGHAPDGAD
jgi:hypothetical protein